MSIVYASGRLELGLVSAVFDPIVFDLTIFDTDIWVDVIDASDVRTGAAPIVLTYGIQGNTSLDLVASSGKLTWPLENSLLNSGAQVGYYSVLNALKRTNFAVNIPVRLTLSCPDVASGTLYYKFRGTLDDVTPDFGSTGPRVSYCTALDWMNDAAITDEPVIDLPLLKRSDEVVTSILDALVTQPIARTLEVGAQTFALSLDGGTGQRLKVRERLNQICLSERGYCYIKGDTTQGGTFFFENRHHRAQNSTVMFAFDASVSIMDLSVPSNRSQQYRTVRVTVHPTNDFAVATPIVLFSLQSATPYVAAGATNIAIFGAYFDPTTNNVIGGDATDATYDPVAITDFLMNTASDGSGTDVTTNFAVTSARTGSGVAFTIVNSGTSGAYVTKLQQQGRPIYRYVADVSKTVAGAFGDQVLDIDMPFADNTNTAESVATYLSNLLAIAYANAQSIRFMANQSAACMAAALQLEPGDRISITESVTGLDAALFTINSVNLELYPGGILYCTFSLAATNNIVAWVAGVSLAGTETIPGF